MVSVIAKKDLRERLVIHKHVWITAMNMVYVISTTNVNVILDSQAKPVKI